MHSSETATRSSRFRIVIPKAVRSARDWCAGQTFAFIPKGQGILLVPIPERDTHAGLAPGAKAEGYRDGKDRI